MASHFLKLVRGKYTHPDETVTGRIECIIINTPFYFNIKYACKIDIERIMTQETTSHLNIDT